MSGTSGENPRRCTSFEPESDIAPYVRPWNAPRKAITRVRPVWKRASFKAASSASAPLFVKNTRLADGPGAASAKPLGQVDLRLVVEVGPRHVQQLVGLVLDGGDDFRVAMPGGGHGDAGRHVEEAVAVHVFDDGPAAAGDDERVDAGVRWGDELGVPFEQRLSAGARAEEVWTQGARQIVEQPHGQPPLRTDHVVR